MESAELAHGSAKDKTVTLELAFASAQSAIKKLKQAADSLAHHLIEHAISVVLVKGYLSDDYVEAFDQAGIAVCHGIDKTSFDYACSASSCLPWSPFQPIGKKIAKHEQ